MASAVDLHDMAALLTAAKEAVRHAARLSVRVQRGMSDADKVVKSDASPVTVADYGCQAVVSYVLSSQIGSFRLMAEEDAETLVRAGETLLQHVVAAVHAAAGAGDGSPALPRPPGGWTADTVLSAIAAGTHGGGAEDGGYWVLDPIDGTKGFLRYGQYAVGLAYVHGGAVQLSAIACPNLPFPSWWEGERGLGAAEGGLSSGRVGTLFTCVRGGGAWMEGLPASSCTTEVGAVAHAHLAPPVRIRATQETDMSRAVLCESFDPGHSNHDVSGRVAAALGLHSAGAAGGGRPSIRIDSMCKYGLLARGDGHLYLRLPRCVVAARACCTRGAYLP